MARTVAGVRIPATGLSFLGQDPVVTLGAIPAFALTNTAPWTVEAIVQPFSLKSSRIFTNSFNFGTNKGFLMGTAVANGQLYMEVFYGNSSVALSATGFIAQGQKTFLSATFDGSGHLDFHMNGNFFNRFNVTMVAGDATANSYIGNEATGAGAAWKGTMFGLRYSNIARYTNSNYTVPAALTSDANTLGLWLFAEGTGTTTADSSGNGHTGTFGGGTNPIWLKRTAASATRKNYCYNPSFEVGTTRWGSANPATLTRITTDFLYGIASLQVDCTTTSASGARYTSPAIAIQRGQKWTGSGYVKAKTAGDIGKTIALHVIEQTGGSEVLQNVVLTSGWTRVSLTKTITTNNSGGFLLDFREDNGVAVGFLLDGVLLENTDLLYDYFDGGLTGGTWEGTANNSISDFVVTRFLASARSLAT